MSVAEVPPGASGPETFGIDPDVHARRWWILASLCLSLVMIVVAISSLNVALPEIQRALDASGTELSWLIDAYALVFAGVLLPAGALGDRFGRRGALQFGLVVFGLAVLAASAAEDPSQLIAARVVMGVGAAFIMPATLSIIIHSFPFHERPKAIALWAGFAGVGGALGPISSGLLLENFWWGAIFFVNVPLVAVLLLLSWRILPTSKDPSGHPLDLVGAGLAMTGLVSLVFAVIEGPEQGWLDPVTVGAFVAAVVLLVGFVRWELRHETPMLDPRLFRMPGFAGGSAAVTLAFFSMFSMFFLLTQYLQFVKGYSALGAGLRVLPNALSLVLIAPQAPRIVGRFGVRRAMRTGFLLTAVAFALLATADRSSPDLLVLVAMTCTGAGMGLLMPGASQHIVGSLPMAKAGVGSAVNDVTREVGGALGIAVTGSVVATVFRASDFESVIPATDARQVAGESVGQALGVARGALDGGFIERAEFDALVAAAADAFNDGTRIAFALLAVVAVVAGLVISRVIPDQLPSRDH
ncbi:MAG: MFS transporter [Actinomycetota bacterium]|nr:MFS transporter [Actinomycetota bacterium]